MSTLNLLDYSAQILEFGIAFSSKYGSKGVNIEKT